MRTRRSPAPSKHHTVSVAGVAAAVAAAVLTACAADPPAASSPSDPLITERAGVRTVVNYEPRWAPGEAWTVSEEPVLRIGMVDGPEAYLFNDIRGVTRLSDGTIVVLNAGDGQIRYFAPDGRHLRTVGRLGNGPAEMVAPRWLERLDGDVVQITHTYGRHRYGPDGTLLTDERMYWENIHSIGRAAAFAGSAGFLMESCGVPTPLFLAESVLLCASTYTDVRFMPDRTGVHHSRALVAISEWALETLDTVGIFAISDMVMYPSQGRLYPARYGPPHGPRGIMRVTGSPTRLVYADVRHYRIEVHELGGARRTLVIERAGATRPPTDDEMAGFDRALTQGINIDRGIYPPGNPADFRSQVTAVDSLSILLSSPGPVVDHRGAVWAAVAPEPLFGPGPRTFDVFDASGIYLGEVTMQNWSRIHEIGDDYVLRVERDDVGVEYVALHELRGRSAGGR
jgi:hypothetical protein